MIMTITLSECYHQLRLNDEFTLSTLTDHKGATYRVTATAKRKGVTIICSLYCGNSIQVIAKIRTVKAGYRQIEKTQFNDQSGLAILSKIVENAFNYKPLDASLLPKPYKFMKARYSKGMNHKRGAIDYSMMVTSNSILQCACVVRLVTIGPDWILQDSELMVPETRCWYLMYCGLHSGLSTQIITDGNVFYPVGGSSAKLRVDVKSNISIKRFLQASIADKELLAKAIEVWITHNFSPSTAVS
jgi:hypothetical protein